MLHTVSSNFTCGSLWYGLLYVLARFGGINPLGRRHCLLILFGVLRFQHCTDHIMTGSFMGRGNQYVQLVKVLYCTLLTIGKQLPTFTHKIRGLNCQPQRWEASVLPLHHRGPSMEDDFMKIVEKASCDLSEAV